MRRYLFLLLLTLSGGFTAFAQPSVEETWQQANTAYINNDYRAAIEGYEGILAGGQQSSRLYYNLANGYFKSGQLGRAILNYHRALRLNPGDTDARYNLQVAEGMTQDRIEKVPEFFLKGWLREFRCLVSGNGWATLSLVALALMLVAVLCYLLPRRLVLRKTGFYGTLIFLLLFVVSLRFAAIERREAIDRTTAIVMREAVAVKSAPDAAATDLFILHEGTELEITNRLGEWCEIGLADGKKGWMEATKLEAI